MPTFPFLGPFGLPLPTKWIIGFGDVLAPPPFLANVEANGGADRAAVLADVAREQVATLVASGLSRRQSAWG